MYLFRIHGNQKKENMSMVVSTTAMKSKNMQNNSHGICLFYFILFYFL